MIRSIREKLERVPKELKASVGLFIGSLISKGISYVTTPIFTRILSSEEFGQVTVFFTWQNVFGIIAMFCLMNGVFNNGMVDYPGERDKYSFSMLGLSNVITITFGLLIFILYPFLHKKISLEFYQFILMLLVFLFQPAYSFWTARQRYEYKYKATLIWSVILAVISPTIAIIAIKYFPGSKLKARLIGAELPMIFIYVGFYIYLASNSKYKIDKRFWKPAFLFNLPLIPHYLSSLLLSSSDRLMISGLIGDTETAYYGVAASIAAVVLIVWNAVNSSLIPFTYEKCKVKDYASIAKVTNTILSLFGICCLLLVLIAPELVAFMAPKEYMEAVYVIPPLVGGVFFQVMYYIFSNVVYYYKKPVYVMIASISATVLNLILNYIFIRKFGYIAAAYTTITCYIVQAAIDYFAMKMVVGNNIYNMTFIISISAVVIIIAFACNALYSVSPLIRYLIIFIMVISAFIMREKIKRIYYTVKG